MSTGNHIADGEYSEYEKTLVKMDVLTECPVCSEPIESEDELIRFDSVIFNTTILACCKCKRENNDLKESQQWRPTEN